MGIRFNCLYVLCILSLLFGGCGKGQIGDEPIAKSSGESDNYYWCRDQKVPLERYDGRRFILYDADDESSLLGVLEESGIDVVVEPKELTLGAIVNPIDSTRKRVSALDNAKWLIADCSKSETIISEIPSVIYDAPSYITENGDFVGLSNLFYVKMKSEDDLTKVNELAMNNSVDVLGRNNYMPLWITLSCSKQSAGNALEMSNLFFESGDFDASEPDFIGGIQTDD